MFMGLHQIIFIFIAPNSKICQPLHDMPKILWEIMVYIFLKFKLNALVIFHSFDWFDEKYSTLHCNCWKAGKYNVTEILILDYSQM